MLFIVRSTAGFSEPPVLRGMIGQRESGNEKLICADFVWLRTEHILLELLGIPESRAAKELPSQQSVQDGTNEEWKDAELPGSSPRLAKEA